MASPVDSSQRPRVVSLLPSATEILALLGANIVGRSHECDWPPSVLSAPALTGAYNKFENSRQMHDAVTETMRQGRGLYTLDEQTLAAVRPDIVVTQSLCSVCAVDLDIVRQAAQRLDPPPRVVDTNPQNLYDVIADVARLGAELGPGAEAAGAEAAAALRRRVDTALAAAKRLAAARSEEGAAPPRVVFIEWVSPLFPGGHWTPQMIEMAGGCCPINPPTRPGGGALPSGEMPHSRVVEADPDLVIVAPCGLDLDTTRREVQEQLAHEDWWRGLRAVRQGRVALVDGNQHFNRPGPRLVDALEWLVGWIGAGGRQEHVAATYPQPEGFPWEQLAPLEQEKQEAGAGAGAGAAEAHGVQGAAMPGGTRLRPLAPCSSASPSASPSSPDAPTTPRGDTAQRVPRAEPAAAAAAAAEADGGCECGRRGAGEAEAGPWVPPANTWSAAPNLAPDIEDLHAAACQAGRGTYADPVTGFTVFTELGLARRSTCCGNGCRHCPWAHYKVVARPRANRLRTPALLRPSPGARTVPQVQRQQQQQQQQQPGGWRRWFGGSGGSGEGPERGASGAGAGGPDGGVLLVCYEPGPATGALIRAMRSQTAKQAVALLVGYDVDSNATWGNPAAVLGAGRRSSSSGSGSGGGSSKGRGGPQAPGLAGAGEAGATLYDAMDVSMEYDIDLVAVPLQVQPVAGQGSGRSRRGGSGDGGSSRWMNDPVSCAAALRHVVEVAGQLLQAPIAAVVSAQGETPRLFAPGTADCVPGGWKALVEGV